MCASPSLRCGACLAKYNGSSWEECYKSVLLVKSWTLVLNKDSQLCIDGHCDFGGGVTVCMPITDRLNSYWVTSQSTLVKLQGILNTKKLPEFVAKRFSQGFPVNWRYVVNRWASYVQSGGKATFCWEEDDSFFSSDTSIFMTRSRRRSSAGRDTSTTSIDRSQSDLANDPERDSTVPTSDSSGYRNSNSKSTSCGVTSPWLPAHKLKAINQWIDGSHHPVEPEFPLAVNANDGSLLPVPEESAVTSRNRAQRKDVSTQSLECEVPLSTPQGVERNSRLIRELEMWNVSKINSEHSDVDKSLYGKLFSNQKEVAAAAAAAAVSPPLPRRGRVAKSSPNLTSKGSQLPASSSNKSGSVNNFESGQQCPSGEVPFENVFRKPKDFSKNSVPKNSEKSDPKKSDSVQQKTNNNSEVPGSHMGRMLSSSLRPRRKHQIQKIERWRPVIGVDGYLKVQGYLLLSNDMTAGQILTTNTVVEWGKRTVKTCDGRAYELIGEPYRRIPDDLKSQLVSAMKCEDIVARLKESQALRDDVTEWQYLAPPPAPLMVNMTRSGRLSRPRAPHWLNRADWGAEYEYFYGNRTLSKPDSPYSTRLSHNSKNSKATLVKEKSKTDSKVLNSRDLSPTEEMGSPTILRYARRLEKNNDSSSKALSYQKSGTSKTPIAQKEQNSSESDSSSSHRKSARTSERKSLNKSQEREHSNKDLVASVTNVSRPLLPAESSAVTETVSSQDKLCNMEKDYLLCKSSADLKRSFFENVTWRASQNQLMLPSPRLTQESPNVDFSSSRIKVSYLDTTPKSVQRTVPSLEDSPPKEVQWTKDSSYKSKEGTTKSRPSRSSVRRSLYPCCEDVQSFPSSVSPSSHRSHIDKQCSPLLPRTLTQAASPPVKKAAGTRVLRARKNVINYNLSVLCSDAEKPHGPTRHPSVPSRKQQRSASPPPARHTHTLRSKAKLRSTSASSVVSPSKGNAANKDTQTRAAIIEKTPAAVITEKKRIYSASESPRQSARRKGKQLHVMVERINTKSLPKKRQNTPKVSLKKKGRATPLQPNLYIESEEESEVGTSKENKMVQKRKQTIAKKGPSKINKGPAKPSKVKGKKSIVSSGESSSENDDAASECSNSTDMSVGPSASIIFALDNSPGNHRAPRTLRERHKKDEDIAEMGRRLAAKETVIDTDDDPMAHLLAADIYAPFPAEWCKHENFFNQNRKRRRPSSSDGTVSPFRSGFDDTYGNEDATSSVATPQLLMKPPDPKQVQSYLQRQRAWNAKPQRPKRQTKKSKDLELPEMDYAAVFRDDPSDSEASSVSNWEED